VQVGQHVERQASSAESSQYGRPWLGVAGRGGHAAGLCESCNTAHEQGLATLLPPRTSSRTGSLSDVAEEEARQIALILSVTNAHDGRNKHLREKLMTMPPSPPPSSAAPGRGSRSSRASPRQNAKQGK
jgi:hypothetical protein